MDSTKKLALIECGISCQFQNRNLPCSLKNSDGFAIYLENSLQLSLKKIPKFVMISAYEFATFLENGYSLRLQGGWQIFSTPWQFFSGGWQIFSRGWQIFSGGWQITKLSVFKKGGKIIQPLDRLFQPLGIFFLELGRFPMSDPEERLHIAHYQTLLVDPCPGFHTITAV